MKIRTLSSAYNDLKAGRKFYEKQGEGPRGIFFRFSVFRHRLTDAVRRHSSQSIRLSQAPVETVSLCDILQNGRQGKNSGP